MTSHQSLRALAAALAGLLLGVVGAVVLAAPAAARAGDVVVTGPERPPPDARPPPPGSQRFVISLRYPPWQYTGRFKLEGPDGRLDEGVSRDQGGAFGMEGTDNERVLEGAHGTLRLRLRGSVRLAAGIPLHFGRWEIVEGTGAWEGLSGGGTYLSTTSGDSTRGSANEVQTLIGHLVRPAAAQGPRREKTEKSQKARLRTIETSTEVPSGK